MDTSWNLNVDGQWIAWLKFDSPGEKVNKFTSAVMESLDHQLELLAHDTTIRALVIVSGKPDSFVVGADIAELAAIDSAAEAREKAQAGQRLFNKIQNLDVPTLAVIHGACMGGGTEMALACDYRLATDDPKTSIGLPEVKLGIIPGWGGTQRLPQIVGLSEALTRIMTGSAVSARKAYRIGLVDGLVAKTFLEEQTLRFVDRIGPPKGRNRVLARRRQVRPLMIRLIEWTPPGRALIYRQAAKQALKRSKGHYPAPQEALEVVQKSFRGSMADGLALEAQAFSRLAPSLVSQNLVWVFQTTQSMKKTHRPAQDEKPKSISNSAVVGAGVMGGGIAWALSQGGLPVRLKDIAWDAAAKGLSTAAGMFKAAVDRRKMTRSQMSLAVHRIMATTGFDGFSAKLDLVIEAVVENTEVKKKVLQEIESHVGSETLICSNTSSLSISEMATALEHPERFVGLHFFNPVNRMPLIEVIPGSKTSPQTVVAAVALARRLGKTPVVVRDSPGFLVNRILLPYVNESIRMFEEGVDLERIDRLIEAFGMPMGPLALADEVGLDVGFKVSQVLADAFGQRMEVAGMLGNIVAQGSLLGKKSGGGFYSYRKGKAKKPNPEAAKFANSDVGHLAGVSDQQIVDRAVLTMINEAARCLEENVVENAQMLDMAMLLGTGFAPFRGGLLRWGDLQGVVNIARRLNALAAKFGDRFKPAPLIDRLVEDGGQFYQDAIVSTVKTGG